MSGSETPASPTRVSFQRVPGSLSPTLPPPPDTDNESFDYADSYITEALCTGCDTDLLHLLPNPLYLAEEPSIRKLVDAVCAVIAEYDQSSDIQEVGGDPLETAMETLATATDAVGGESR